MVIREKIIGFIYGVVTGSKRYRRLLTPLFALVFFSIVLMLILGSFLIDRFLGLPRFLSMPWSMAMSMPFLVIGGFMWLWSAGIFFQTKGTPVPVNPPPKLVTNGPYAYSRNPMMTGLFMVVAGIGIFFGSVTLTFIMTPLFVVMSILEFKYIEEPELMKRFGQEYVEYRKRTPIIIPEIWKPKME